VIPCSHLSADSSTSQADSFITSRPWLMFAVDMSEEAERYSHTPLKISRHYKGSIGENVRELWKERGEWETEWRDPRKGETLIGWKWRHESSSPEPEDLSGLGDLATFELTPSEVDALKAVAPPPLRPFPSTSRPPTPELGS
jgi:hypothetical protein